MVYDNYNGLVIGFGPTERASQGIVSLAIFPRWVTLCFIQNGPDIPDPGGLLKWRGTSYDTSGCNRRKISTSLRFARCSDTRLGSRTCASTPRDAAGW